MFHEYAPWRRCSVGLKLKYWGDIYCQPVFALGCSIERTQTGLITTRTIIQRWIQGVAAGLRVPCWWREDASVRVDCGRSTRDSVVVDDATLTETTAAHLCCPVARRFHLHQSFLQWPTVYSMSLSGWRSIVQYSLAHWAAAATVLSLLLLLLQMHALTAQLRLWTLSTSLCALSSTRSIISLSFPPDWYFCSW